MQQIRISDLVRFRGLPSDCTPRPKKVVEVKDGMVMLEGRDAWVAGSLLEVIEMDFSAYGPELLEQHRLAFAKAKAQAICNCYGKPDYVPEHHRDCPCSASQLALRAEELRKEMAKSL